ncbi:MAG: protein-glutamate O-methyltransferase CheR, partial [Deltaproteobacteria bacterium]|nr:protein-glutamate O-methyltransferase CheR [Kofleriaceae bacterium]
MALPRDIVAGLTRRLAERAGLELPAWVVEARARARMEALRLGATEYLELVATPRGRVELDELVEAVRVGETRFFRHVSQVQALVDVVAPAIAARGRRNVRVWSAGCASGEEAYTLAIVLSRELPEHAVTVVATDVSEDALAVAARGRYPRAALAHVPEAWRDAFEPVGAGGGGEGDEVRVKAEIAKRVTFEQANLVEGEAPRGCQVVWCRNVLIYFEKDARKRAVQKLISALDAGGWLFVGYSEQLRDVAELEAVRAGDVTIYVKRTPGSNAATRTPVVGVPIQGQGQGQGQG